MSVAARLEKETAKQEEEKIEPTKNSRYTTATQRKARGGKELGKRGIILRGHSIAVEDRSRDRERGGARAIPSMINVGTRN